MLPTPSLSRSPSSSHGEHINSIRGETPTDQSPSPSPSYTPSSPSCSSCTPSQSPCSSLDPKTPSAWSRVPEGTNLSLRLPNHGDSSPSDQESQNVRKVSGSNARIQVLINEVIALKKHNRELEFALASRTAEMCKPSPAESSDALPTRKTSFQQRRSSIEFADADLLDEIRNKELRLKDLDSMTQSRSQSASAVPGSSECVDYRQEKFELEEARREVQNLRNINAGLKCQLQAKKEKINDLIEDRNLIIKTPRMTSQSPRPDAANIEMMKKLAMEGEKRREVEEKLGIATQELAAMQKQVEELHELRIEESRLRENQPKTHISIGLADELMADEEINELERQIEVLQESLADKTEKERLLEEAVREKLHLSDALRQERAECEAKRAELQETQDRLRQASEEKQELSASLVEARALVQEKEKLLERQTQWSEDVKTPKTLLDDLGQDTVEEEKAAGKNSKILRETRAQCEVLRLEKSELLRKLQKASGHGTEADAAAGMLRTSAEDSELLSIQQDLARSDADKMLLTSEKHQLVAELNARTDELVVAQEQLFRNKCELEILRKSASRTQCSTSSSSDKQLLTSTNGTSAASEKTTNTWCPPSSWCTRALFETRVTSARLALLLFVLCVSGRLVFYRMSRKERRR